MGYRCPVCEDPQADDTHLANHLAFTAILRGGDHEGWLNEHVPGWEEMGETDLAPRVTEFAESAEFPVRPDDATGRVHREEGGHDDDHSHEHGHEGAQDVGRSEISETPFGAGIDEEAREAIEQAREMTRQRRANASNDKPDTDGPDSEDGDSRDTESSDSPKFEGDSESGGEQ
ncbi:MAG: hypothetical protein J07HX64_01558 [halophilic archaeon J07HX64]|jgi:hypothetical protein|nr:MAG: hypothetical protein J07HX64_01558 [halophilic archaeon J07HX64]